MNRKRIGGVVVTWDKKVIKALEPNALHPEHLITGAALFPQVPGAPGIVRIFQTSSEAWSKTKSIAMEQDSIQILNALPHNDVRFDDIEWGKLPPWFSLVSPTHWRR